MWGGVDASQRKGLGDGDRHPDPHPRKSRFTQPKGTYSSFIRESNR